MIKEAIQTLSRLNNLTAEEAEKVLDEIMTNQANDFDKSAFLMGLATKGATIEEITGSASSLRKHALQITPNYPVLEIVGTGGDQSNTFNISTTAAIVVAATGLIPVAKHGNRAATSKSGAADVLEALGVDLMVSPEQSLQSLKNNGIYFLFAQKYHQAMKFVAPVRKSLPITTIFNYLGPLANPAGAQYQVLGVSDEKLVEPMAHVLDQLGVVKAIVVHGDDGLDEVTLTAKTNFVKLDNHHFTKGSINPEKLGFSICKPTDLVGGTPTDNAQITQAILNGEKGPKRDVVVLNAAVALHLVKSELSLQEAIQIVKETIDSGMAKAKLFDFIKTTNDGAEK
ncbi:anthranilate phosphoribosyltransferase [Fructilactobacillus vespulae]|uniref:anthranilate phosphoribosyltransferase n=1 Tax=Fructilactobacillus vespulae TaxID=1249630 RepID=UPI0039B54D40